MLKLHSAIKKHQFMVWQKVWGVVTSFVHMQMPMELHSTVVWSQVLIKDIRTSCQFGQKYAQVDHWRLLCKALAVLLLFFLAQRSQSQSCSWVEALLTAFTSPLCNHPSPGISSTLSRLCWELQQTFLQWNVPSWRSWTTSANWMCCSNDKRTRKMTVTKDIYLIQGIF